MSKKKDIPECTSEALVEPPKLGGNLIERARSAAFLNAPSSICPLLNELAGEVERLWHVEENTVEARLRYASKLATMEAEHAAEVDRIKSTVDTAAIQKAYYRGYVAATAQMAPIITTMIFQANHDSHEH